MKASELRGALDRLGLDGPLAPILDALDAGLRPADTRYGLYELGFNSEDACVQVNQIHALRRDGLSSSARAAAVERKCAAALASARLAGTGFELGLFERVLSVLRASGSAGDRTLFSFEWDRASRRVSKLTLYGGVYSRAEADALAALLATGEPKVADWLSRELWNFGVDFLADGAWKLKIYRRRPFEPAAAEGRLPAEALALHAEAPFHDLASMLVLAPGAKPPYPEKWGAAFERGLALDRLAASPAMAARSAFLMPLAAALGPLELSYVAWSGRGLGVYCGRGLAAWLKWLPKPAEAAA